MEELLQAIWKQVDRDFQVYDDLYHMSKEALQAEDTNKLGLSYLKKLSANHDDSPTYKSRSFFLAFGANIVITVGASYKAFLSFGSSAMLGCSLDT